MPPRPNTRLLTRFELTADNNDLDVVSSISGAKTVTIPAGLYYWSLDDDVTAGQLDFGKAVEDALAAAYAGLTWVISIIGVNHTDATKADGRPRYLLDNGTFDFDFGTGTVDPRIFGFPTGSGVKGNTNDLDGEHVHRYGWYPQESPGRVLPYPVPDTHAAYTTGGFPDVIDWGEHEETELLYDNIGSPLVRAEAAAVAALAAQYNLETGDENAPYTRWGVDTARTGQRWRYYDDIAAFSIADFAGPYMFPAISGLWLDPLAGPAFAEDDQAEHWTIPIPGRTLPAGA